MGDPWQDEGFGGENDWDEGKESIETDLEDGLEDPEEPEEEDDTSWEDEPDAE